MTAIATINSVTTTDAHPTVAPHRISAIVGWDEADVVYTPDDTETLLCCSEDLGCSGDLTCGDAAGSGPIRVVRMMFEGASRGTGQRLTHLGVMCGLDVCDGADAGNVPLRMEGGTVLEHDILYADLELMPGSPLMPGAPLVPGQPPLDGDYPVTVYVFSANSGDWSS
jgi:hypothetical protein